MFDQTAHTFERIKHLNFIRIDEFVRTNLSLKRFTCSFERIFYLFKLFTNSSLWRSIFIWSLYAAVKNKTSASQLIERRWLMMVTLLMYDVDVFRVCCCKMSTDYYIKVALGVSPQFLSIWTRVLNHNKYVEIKQFSKEDIKQNNIYTVILLIKFLVYQWDPRHLLGSRVVYIFIYTLYSCSN